MTRKPTNGTSRSEDNGNALKTFAVKLSPALHSSLVLKATEHGVSLQSLGEQLVELFLNDGIELKVNVAVTKELAVLLQDSKLSAEVLAAFKSKSVTKK